MSLGLSLVVLTENVVAGLMLVFSIWLAISIPKVGTLNQRRLGCIAAVRRQISVVQSSGMNLGLFLAVLVLPIYGIGTVAETLNMNVVDSSLVMKLAGGGAVREWILPVHALDHARACAKSEGKLNTCTGLDEFAPANHDEIIAATYKSLIHSKCVAQGKFVDSTTANTRLCTSFEGLGRKFRVTNSEFQELEFWNYLNASDSLELALDHSTVVAYSHANEDGKGRSDKDEEEQLQRLRTHYRITRSALIASIIFCLLFVGAQIIKVLFTDLFGTSPPNSWKEKANEFLTTVLLIAFGCIAMILSYSAWARAEFDFHEGQFESKYISVAGLRTSELIIQKQSNKNRQAFIAMPYGDAKTPTTDREKKIQSALAAVGIVGHTFRSSPGPNVAGDANPGNTTMMAQIDHLIEGADVLVADLTDEATPGGSPNINVIEEVGRAHGKGKPTILIRWTANNPGRGICTCESDAMKMVPFNLTPWQIYCYAVDDELNTCIKMATTRIGLRA